MSFFRHFTVCVHMVPGNQFVGNLSPVPQIIWRYTIAREQDISVRTLYRWEKLHTVGGFTALKPANRAQRRSMRLPKNFSEVLQQAILLKREVPLRSVEQIIYILVVHKSNS